MFASPIGSTDIDKDYVPGERTRAFYELRGKDFKHEMYELGLSLEKHALDAGVEIRCDTEVTAEYVQSQNADVCINSSWI